MKKKLIAFLSFMALTIPAIPAVHAHADDVDVPPQIDELAETKLDGEIEAQDQEQLQTDNTYAKEEAASAEQQLKEAKHQTDQIKRQNERAAQGIKERLARAEAERKAAAEAKASVEKLQIELVNNRKEIDQLKEKVDRLRQQRDQIKQKGSKVRVDVARAEMEKRQLARQEAQIKRQVQIAQARLKADRERRNHVIAQNRALKSRVHKKAVAALRITKTKMARAED